ncbi:hypothetical protein [Aeromonas veronii]|nr:hypothetical protein [Aeromonas veronii]MCF5915294.1 hypothetical protein [Aeromonas veronii]
MKPLESNSLCFIDEYPQEGAEGEDVFPSDVIKMIWSCVIMVSSLFML